jgi:hypothetical protein
MQTDHYMANMGKPGLAERPDLADLEGVDEVESRNDLSTSETGRPATRGQSRLPCPPAAPAHRAGNAARFTEFGVSAGRHRGIPSQ